MIYSHLLEGTILILIILLINVTGTISETSKYPGYNVQHKLSTCPYVGRSPFTGGSWLCI